MLVGALGLALLVAATPAGHGDASTGLVVRGPSSGCGSGFGRVVPIPVVVAKQLLVKGTLGSTILYKQLYVPMTIPCKERREGAIGNPGLLVGRILELDLFPGQQLARSDFSGRGTNRPDVRRGSCKPGTEYAPSPVLVAKTLIRKGTRGSVVLRKQLYSPTTLPCRERVRGVLTDPALFRRRVAAKWDIFLGQQLARSQFSAR